MELNYATKGTANAGLATGIIGTALGVLNGAGNVGLGMARSSAGTNGHDCAINRYEFSEMMKYQNELMAKDLQISELQSEKISDQKDIELYKAIKQEMNTALTGVNSQIASINQTLGNQAVLNQSVTDNLAILDGAITREKDTRKANDKIIVTYSNATFTPKTVVTTSYSGGTITPSSAPQPIYDPLPCCDCND